MAFLDRAADGTLLYSFRQAAPLAQASASHQLLSQEQEQDSRSGSVLFCHATENASA
jgi:hypothetical protein